jgi:hypothetical protein
MKIRCIVLYAFFCIPFFAAAQFTAPVGYNGGVPSGAPSETGTRLRFNTLTNRLYTYSPDLGTWVALGQGVDIISGGVAPSYAPVRGQSSFAVNADGELYQYSGSGVSWNCLNCAAAAYNDWRFSAGGGPNQTVTTGEVVQYIGGDGISTLAISGNGLEITNTMPDLEVTLNGTGITVGGTYPNFTLTATDQSASNELQTITINGQELTLSNGGGTITIPGGSVDTPDSTFYNQAYKWNGTAWAPAPDGTQYPTAFRYFVSPAGSNAASGLTPALAKQTIAGLSGLLTANKSTGLKAGSQFREQLTPTAHGLIIGAYARTDANRYAVINGSDVHNSGWTSVSSYFTKSIAHSLSPIDGYNGIVVMEIDTTLEKTAPLSAINYLTYVANTTLVNSTAGSYTYTFANPSTVAIRPTSGSPGSNKYRYEVVTRMAGIEAYAYNNLNVSNIWFKSAGAGYGPINAGDNTTLNNVIITGGATHHFVLKSGHINNAYFGRTSLDMVNGSTPATFYEVNASGNVSSIRNSIFYKTQNAFIAHTSGGGNHRKISFDNVYFFGDSTVFGSNTVLGGDQIDTFLVNRFYVDNTGSVGNPAVPYMEFRNSMFVNMAKPGFLFNHPNDNVREAIFDNIFFKTYAHNGNQSTASTGSARLFYTANSNTSVTIQNSTVHVKSSWTTGGINQQGGFSGAKTVLNNIIISEVSTAFKVPNGAPTTSNYNVYIFLSGAGFRWSVNPALNGGDPEATLAQWQSISGQDANSIAIDLSSNPLGLRAVFVDPDGGNYTLLPGGQYTAQILAIQAGMRTPLRGWITTPTPEQSVEAVMTGAVPLLMDWKQFSSGSPYNVPTNYVKYTPAVLTAGRIPVVTAFNTIQDYVGLTYAPASGLYVKSTNNSSGNALQVENGDGRLLISAGNAGVINIGWPQSNSNTSTFVNLYSLDGSDNPSHGGIRLASHQNGSISPPNLSWWTHISGTFQQQVYQIRGMNNAAFIQRSPSNGATWFEGYSTDNTTTVTNTVTNLPASYPWCQIPQLTYISKGTLVIGADLASSNDAADGLIRSGQKNNGVVGYNSAPSNLTYQAGRGLGPVVSNKGEHIWQTPDAAATGTVQPYTTKMNLKNDGKLGILTTSPTAQMDINAATGYNQLRLRTTYTPTGSADANGNTGDVSWDANYLYIKTGAGAWKRAALSTF